MALSGKAEAKEIIDGLPDDVTLDDIVYAMYVHIRIERGLRDAEAGNLIDHQDMKRDMAAWRESVGRKLLAESTGASSNT